jgi:hypothetical protein
MRAHIGDAVRVGCIAALANGVATWAMMRQGRMSPAEFGVSAFVVFVFAAAAWFTTQSIRQRPR